MPAAVNPAYFTGISPAGAAMLQRLIHHPHAPRFRNQSGHRLLPNELNQLDGYIRKALIQSIASPYTSLGMVPDFLNKLLKDTQEQVPAFAGALPVEFAEIPTTCRADLSRDFTRYVPQPLPLERLICFSTSGTTGHPLTIPSYPMVAARYQAFHRRALAHFGIVPCAKQGEVAVALVGSQARCFTYASINPLQAEAGLVKLNLNEADWHHPADRSRYLDDLAPELITGDPISLMALADLPLQHQPKAILSTSMQMLDGTRQYLERRFACPVLDIYSMNEAGPIAVFDPMLGGHVLLQPELWVEIVDEAGRLLPLGERGEITLSGGFNPWLPLRRYRTGDYAAMALVGQMPVLMGLSGRPPVRFCTVDGCWINNVDISQALQHFMLQQFSLHQAHDGSLRLQIVGDIDLLALRQQMTHLLGNWPLNIETRPALGEKIIQYTSDFLAETCRV
ncbi:capsule biosynthesis protein CapK [Chitinibacter fontanus]|uniref:Capsule biosynthesis protein CapK n=1 Tax=Chitinibacter fontanus TaxID=1737446 RepID=A0A7D5VCK4_9NEIS|nr:capsule biosynthesis protein CapK [Chitinibacter fontanus]